MSEYTYTLSREGPSGYPYEIKVHVDIENDAELVAHYRDKKRKRWRYVELTSDEENEIWEYIEDCIADEEGTYRYESRADGRNYY